MSLVLALHYEEGGGADVDISVYDQVDDDDGFMFSKGSKKGKGAKASGTTATPAAKPTAEAQAGAGANIKPAAETPAEAAAPKTAKKARRKMPTTPERDAADRTVRRSKRISSEHEQPQPEPQASPIRPSHAKSHQNTDAQAKDRSPTPEKVRPLTVEKKRKRFVEPDGDGGEHAVEERTERIALPFADTPVIKRNKEMRKASADMAAKSAAAGGSRRTSSGMRGKRASSLMDEGKGNGEFVLDSFTVEVGFGFAISGGYDRVQKDAGTSGLVPLSPRSSVHSSDGRGRPGPLRARFADTASSPLALPHPEVPASEFYKHISADLTEPRRMRCLLGWCSNRALPPKPSAPISRTPEAQLEFQALQAARVIQAELAQDLVSRGILSDWFSRDESTDVKSVKKAPNPRNVTNASKAEELEAELDRYVDPLLAINCPGEVSNATFVLEPIKLTTTRTD